MQLKTLIESHLENLEERGYKFVDIPKWHYYECIIKGIYVGWMYKKNQFAVGWKLPKETVDRLQDILIDAIEDAVFVRKRFISYHFPSRNIEIQDLEDLITLIEENAEKLQLVEEEKTGVTFSGTVFENLKERGATMSGMFGALVCKASGMELTQTLAEYHTQSEGEIDGVELDAQTEKPISIYECQSGIHRGSYLDETHLNKALGKYLYAPEILPTVRKVVILAGGYSERSLQIIAQRSYELSLRPKPIEVILLKTIRTDNRIGIERIVLPAVAES